MDARLLRLGSYVQLTEDFKFVETKAPAGTVCKVEAIKRNSFYLECKAGDGVCYSEVPVTMVEPIPLTEELLLKADLQRNTMDSLAVLNYHTDVTYMTMGQMAINYLYL